MVTIEAVRRFAQAAEQYETSAQLKCSAGIRHELAAEVIAAFEPIAGDLDAELDPVLAAELGTLQRLRARAEIVTVVRELDAVIGAVRVELVDELLHPRDPLADALTADGPEVFESLAGPIVRVPSPTPVPAQVAS